MWLYIIVNGVINATVSFLAWRGINNMPIFHIYTILEFIVISFFFKSVHNNKLYTLFSCIILLIFIILSVINSIFIQGIWIFNTYSRSIEAVILIGYCIFGLIQLINKMDSFNNSVFWYTSGLLVYFSASFVLFIVANLTLGIDKSLNWILWHIHAFMVFILYIFITKGFYLGKRRG